MSPLNAIAVLDAAVLYPAPLRDFLLRLGRARLYHPRWSDEIQDEWTRNLIEHRPELGSEPINRTRGLMEKAFPEARVTGYEPLIAQCANDPKDRHVLAAAVHSQAAYIVTFNHRHFKPADVAPHTVLAIHPDDFILSLYEAAPQEVIAVIKKHRSELRKPPKTVEQYLDTFHKIPLAKTVVALKSHLDEI